MIHINGVEWENLSLEDIEQAVTSNIESFFFEYKDGRVENKKLVEEISAFANTFGGYIFIGVSDSGEILGSGAWNEQRITSLIHDSIFPIPSYEIKTFAHIKGNVLVIRIDEGTEPPYITNTGRIYERIESSACIIKDSIRLFNLSEKRKEYYRSIEESIRIPDIPVEQGNIMGYIDVGFRIQTRNPEVIFHRMLNTDLSEMTRKINQEMQVCNMSSIYRVGRSIVIIPLRLSCNDGKSSFPAHTNSFIEIMEDGSAKYRILLLKEDKDGDTVNLYWAYTYMIFFKICYEEFFKAVIGKEFVCARKMQRMVINKQFVPKFHIPDMIQNEELKAVNERYLQQMEAHDEEFGQAVYLTNNRIPLEGLSLIDKCLFEEDDLLFESKNIVSVLLNTCYCYLSYVEE